MTTGLLLSATTVMKKLINNSKTPISKKTLTIPVLGCI